MVLTDGALVGRDHESAFVRNETRFLLDESPSVWLNACDVRFVRTIVLVLAVFLTPDAGLVGLEATEDILENALLLQLRERCFHRP